MFRLHLDREASESLVQQAREQIVSALHLGQLRAGDKLPSVRSLSRAWGIDPKTAFRVYHALEREGYVNLRPGSGAYVKEVAPSLLDQARALGLLRLVRKHLAVAERFDVDPGRYSEIVARYARSRLTRREWSEKIGVVECNPEQVSIYTDELQRRLGVSTVSMLLSSVVASERRTTSEASSCRYLVTTDFHFAEVEPFADKLGRRLLCVRLDPQFIQSLLALAARGVLGMIVSDTSFLPAFRRSITRLGLDPRASKRIEAVCGFDRERTRALIARSDAVYLSPLCAAEAKGLIPPAMPVLEPDSHLSAESVESIEALLLFGQAGDGARPDGTR